MKRCIVTYAAEAHEELLDVSLSNYKDFAQRHNYELIVGEKKCTLPPAWNKIPLLIDALKQFEEVVWFDCDLIVVNPVEDFPPIRKESFHAMVRHFEHNSEVPNSGVWRVTREIALLLYRMLDLEVFENHGWFEQAALLTMMGYCVPVQNSNFKSTKCRCVRPTKWYAGCEFMRLCWNSHPNYRAEKPRIVHCSYSNMAIRLEVMRKLIKDPTYDYPRYNPDEEMKDEVE